MRISGLARAYRLARPYLGEGSPLRSTWVGLSPELAGHHGAPKLIPGLPLSGVDSIGCMLSAQHHSAWLYAEARRGFLYMLAQHQTSRSSTLGFFKLRETSGCALLDSRTPSVQVRRSAPW